VRSRLRTPYRDGTTRKAFEPLRFMARLAALMLWPRVNQTRYEGMFTFFFDGCCCGFMVAVE
jgi:hypothetical protein